MNVAYRAGTIQWSLKINRNYVAANNKGRYTILSIFFCGDRKKNWEKMQESVVIAIEAEMWRRKQE